MGSWLNIVACVRLVKTHQMTKSALFKTREYPRDIPQLDVTNTGNG